MPQAWLKLVQEQSINLLATWHTQSEGTCWVQQPLRRVQQHPGG